MNGTSAFLSLIFAAAAIACDDGGSASPADASAEMGEVVLFRRVRDA